MKLGLKAMSGIRVCDKELLAMGLTLPGFVERSTVIASLPSLGLLTIAGQVPAHWDVEYLEVRDLAADAPALTGFDLVAISSFSAQIGEGYELAQRFRAAGVPVVMGGLHVTAVPEEAARYCDAVVVGEAEVVWPQLLRDFENGRMQRVYGARNSSFDMNDAPMPAFELLDIDKYNRLTVQTSRGCPWRCEFCAGSILLTNSYKQKPKQKVLAEVNKIRAIWKRPFIEFADDNSFVRRAYWRELLPELARLDVRWFTETDIAIADDDDLLSRMADAGCHEVLIGLESPVPAGLDGLEIRNNWKLKRCHSYVEAIHRIQQHGIRVNGCFVLGLDGQDEGIFERVEKFVREAELFDVQITIQTAFPATPLHERLRAAGRLIEPENWNKCTLFDLNFRPQGMTAEQLNQGFRRLAKSLYSESETWWRRKQFHRRARAYRLSQSRSETALAEAVHAAASA